MDDDDLDEDDGFDADDDSEETIACPYCRREIHEDSERCPYCEQYLSQEDAPASRKPWWVVAGVILCLYLVFRWLTLGS